MTREEFEVRQAATLYIEKAEKAGLIWEETLSGITSLTHRWKWEYMDYLEAIRFKDVDSVNLQEVKEAILTYEEFAEIKELEVNEKELEQVVDDSNEFVYENTVETEIIEQPVIEADIVAEPVDFTKLSIKERAELLSEPTDDIMTEFNAYCKRMGYTEEKVRSIRYKMALYDDFLEEYEYRKKYFGVEEVRTMEKQKKTR